MCSWALPCVSSLVPSVLHLSRGFHCSPAPAVRGSAAADSLVEKVIRHGGWPVQPDVLGLPLLRLATRGPLWLDLRPVGIGVRWGHSWRSALVFGSRLVCGLAVQRLGFCLPRWHWSLLNRFRTEQGHCSVCRRKWRLTDTDLCPCGETQTMSRVIESCPLVELSGSLSRLHSADEDTVSWLTSYGS